MTTGQYIPNNQALNIQLLNIFQLNIRLKIIVKNMIPLIICPETGHKKVQQKNFDLYVLKS